MSEALPLDSVPSVLGSIRLSRVATGLPIPVSYANFATEALLRAHLLPYVLPLKSERALAYELAERPALQIAVGVTDNRAPSRATLWHFRQRNYEWFRRLMVRSLSVMGIDAHQSGISLPCVDDSKDPIPEASAEDNFIDPQTRATVVIQSRRPFVRRNKPVSENLFLPGFPSPQGSQRNERTLLHEVLDFPIPIRWHLGPRCVHKQLVQPSWLESPYRFQDLEAYFGRAKAPYTACNIILLRNANGRDEVLLSRRLRGVGSGSFALPGGKKNGDESIIACVKRELQEEVGVEYQAGRPVSLRITNLPGFPQVRSVGIVATKWHGKPARREHLAHSDWKWYRLDDLPSPLFFPTEWAIDDFLSNSFAELEWSALEPDIPLPLWSD
jgi:8-oxo-dGTP diphosphatase